MNKYVRRVAPLVFAGLMVLQSAPAVYAQEGSGLQIEAGNELEQIEQRKNQIDDAANQLENNKESIERINWSLQEKKDHLARLENDNVILQGDIKALQEEIDRLNESIAANEKEKEELEKKLLDNIEVFEKRLGVMYKNRNIGYVPVLLSSDNVDDFLSRLTTMKSLADYDKKLIDEMKEAKRQLDLVILKLNGERASRNEAMGAMKLKEAELLDSMNDMQYFIRELLHEQSLVAADIEQLNGTLSNLTNEIALIQSAYNARIEREEEERRRKEEERRAEEERVRQERAAQAAREAAERAQAASAESSSVSNYQESSVDYVAPATGYRDLVYFNQREEPWGSASYGNGWAGTIAANGCGPTSMAMVLSSLTGNYVTPIQMANYATANGHVMPGDGGSYWSLFPSAARSYGLSCTQTYSRSAVVDALSRGALVITSQDNSLGNYWTYGGHFIVLTGVNSDGRITVNDPWSRAKSLQSHSQDQVFIPSKSMWIIE